MLIQGASDTTNLMVSRLMLRDNHVVVATNNFFALDKVSGHAVSLVKDSVLRAMMAQQILNDNGPKSLSPDDYDADACTLWVPFEQFEKFYHTAVHNETRHPLVLWKQMLVVQKSLTRLRALFWRRTKLEEVLGRDSDVGWDDNNGDGNGNGNGNDTSSKIGFRESLALLQRQFWRPHMTPSEHLVIKYWPVDAYFHYFRKAKKFMLKNMYLLTDIYFYMILGKVRLIRRCKLRLIGQPKDKDTSAPASATCSHKGRDDDSPENAHGHAEAEAECKTQKHPIKIEVLLPNGTRPDVILSWERAVMRKIPIDVVRSFLTDEYARIESLLSCRSSDGDIQFDESVS